MGWCDIYYLYAGESVRLDTNSVRIHRHRSDLRAISLKQVPRLGIARILHGNHVAWPQQQAA